MLLARLTSSSAPRCSLARTARAAIALAAVALLAAACDVPGISSASSSGATGAVSVGVLQGADNAPVYVGVQNGTFSAHGVQVSVIAYRTVNAEFAALRAGRIQVAEGDYANYLSAQAQGKVSLRLIADGYDAAPNMIEILAVPGSGITSPQSLVNKDVAVPPGQLIIQDGNASNVPYSIEMAAAQSVLSSDGVSPTSVRWQPTPLSSMISALRLHRVDAILVPEPYIFQAESQLGAAEVLDACSGVTAGIPLSGYFSLASYTRQNAGVLASFQAALTTAQSRAGLRGPVTSVLPRSAGMSEQDAALITVGSYPTFLNVGQVQRTAQMIYEAGITENPVNVRSMAFR
jgi:NitT/TauT family transport system substrate-binding protein